jgi:DsbC/DsbD-like thiol-disulfide interchange protein
VLQLQAPMSRRLPVGVIATAAFIAVFSTASIGSQSNRANRSVGHTGAKVETQTRVAVNAGQVNAHVTLLQGRAFSGRPVDIMVDFDVAPGWHIYGTPLPEGYVPASVTFDDELLSAQKLSFPKPTPVKFELLGETLPVYQGHFKATGNIVLRPNLPPGHHTLSGTLNFQACNDNICKMPQRVRFEIPLSIVPPSAKEAGAGSASGRELRRVSSNRLN